MSQRKLFHIFCFIYISHAVTKKDKAYMMTKIFIRKTRDKWVKVFKNRQIQFVEDSLYKI